MKWKSYDKYYQGLPNLISISMPLVWLLLMLWIFFKLCTWFPLILHTRLFIVYAKGLVEYLYTSSKKYFDCGIYLYFVHLLKYEVIIFKRHLVTGSEQSVKRNLISFFMKLLAWLLVLVRVLARWRESTFGMPLRLVKILAR